MLYKLFADVVAVSTCAHPDDVARDCDVVVVLELPRIVVAV